MRAQKSMRAGDGKQCIYLEWPNSPTRDGIGREFHDPTRPAGRNLTG